MGADRAALALALALATGCERSEAPRPGAERTSDDLGAVDVPAGYDGGADDAPVSDATADGALPPGLVVESAPLYRFDTTRAEVTVAVAGDSAHRIVGRLRDAVGRRELFYDDVSFAPAGWHLPPSAAAAPGGATLVCFTTLTGDPSPLSSPGAPDPSRGMTLGCRLRAPTGAWGDRVEVQSPTRGAWLVRVVAREDGTFRVLYYGDDGYLVGPRGEGHGVYEAIFSGASLSAPSLVLPAADPGAGSQ